MKVIGVRWYTAKHCMGIVQVVQDHELEEYRQTGNANFKYYIGVGWGEDEAADTTYIAEHGAIFDPIAGDALFNVDHNA